MRDSVAGDLNAPARKHRSIDVAIIAFLLAALSWFAWQYDWTAPQPEKQSGEIRSLVVLPLNNLMNDDSQSYFVEGMHDAIITELSRISVQKPCVPQTVR